MQQLKVTIGSDGGCRVVEVSGEIDLSTCAQLSAGLDLGRVSATPLVAELRQVRFCDAAGLRTLLIAERRCAACGSALRIVPSEVVARLIELAGLRPSLTVYRDRRHALADCAS